MDHEVPSILCDPGNIGNWISNMSFNFTVLVVLEIFEILILICPYDPGNLGNLPGKTFWSVET